MKKRSFQVILCLAAVLVMLASLVFTVSFASTKEAITDEPLTSGRTFAEGEGLHISKDLDKMPKTYEAVINVPEGTKSWGTIFGNQLASGVYNFNFQINSSQFPLFLPWVNLLNGIFKSAVLTACLFNSFHWICAIFNEV